MDRDLELKIGKAIEESLPAQVGAQLKKQLELIPSLQKEVEDLSDRNKILKEDLVVANKMIEELKSELSKHEKLYQREYAIDKAERNLEIEKLKYQLESEKQKSIFTREVALGLVRNAEYRSNVFENKNLVAGLDQYGNPRTVYVSDNRTEEKTQL